MPHCRCFDKILQGYILFLKENKHLLAYAFFFFFWPAIVSFHSLISNREKFSLGSKRTKCKTLLLNFSSFTCRWKWAFRYPASLLNRWQKAAVSFKVDFKSSPSLLSYWFGVVWGFLSGYLHKLEKARDLYKALCNSSSEIPRDQQRAEHRMLRQS